MHVEECCHALLCKLLVESDKRRSGIAIDIGVGTFLFYCELFAKLGFKTIAVEPLPTEQLRRVCRLNSIQLIESCISDVDGLVSFYIGSFEGQENLNLNSMKSDWWGTAGAVKQVPSMPLSQLINIIDARQIICIKIDVEGLEYAIIKQFLSLEKALLPKILIFEYGGGGTRESKQGGWDLEVFGDTVNSLEALRELGYEQAILIDSAPDSAVRVVDLKVSDFTSSSFFPLQSIYGNIIAFREFEYPESEIYSIGKVYQDNQISPPPLVVPEKLQRKFVRKIKQLIL